MHAKCKGFVSDCSKVNNGEQEYHTPQLHVFDWGRLKISTKGNNLL